MFIHSIKTHTITQSDTDIFRILDQYVVDLTEGSVVAVTSKIIAISEDSVRPIGGVTKETLIQSESDEYLDVPNPYGVVLTIKNSILIASAGIDESNADGNYILWPRDPQAAANRIRAYLTEKFHLQNIGVIITDSVTRPLRWGVTGISIAHSGFQGLHDYRGTPDIFGRPLHFTQSNIADGLAAAAVLVMGEGSECTPMTIISGISFVDFIDRDPTDAEIHAMKISREEDLYGALLSHKNWIRVQD